MRFHKLRIAWSVLCVLASLLLIALWVRSYGTFDRTSGKITSRTSAILISYAGRLTGVVTDAGMTGWNWPKWDSGPILPKNWTYADLLRDHVNWNDTDVLWPEQGRVGFGWIYRALYLNMPNSETGWNPQGLSGRSFGANATGLMVPHWFGVLIFASLACLPWIRWRFSLRTMLIATTLVAAVLGLIVWLR